MTTLSLFDEPPLSFDAGDDLDAETDRDLPAADQAMLGGLTLPVLALAALVASPAIWQCLVRHTVPMHVMLERYVVIALGCLLVSEGVRRLLPSGRKETDGTALDTVLDTALETAPPTLVMTAADESEVTLEPVRE